MTVPLAARDDPPTDDPFDVVINRLRSRGGIVTLKTVGQARATCPAHADRKPSLSVGRGDRGVVLHCFAGCKVNAIAAALGLRMAELFERGRGARTSSPIVASYLYTDREGRPRARKQRTASKAFWWECPCPSSEGKWRRGLGEDGLPGLYRLTELNAAETVFVVEGEKAADRLAACGLTATCGPTGANRWRGPWLVDLLASVRADAVVVILPDNDRPGRRFGELLAVDLTAAARERLGRSIKMKLVGLPGLPRGGDVFDWFEAGHTGPQLLEVVAAAAPWWPGAAAAERASRRSELAKLRMRRHRARHRAGAARVVTPVAIEDRGLDAVVALLSLGTYSSGRAVKAALKGVVSRAVVEDALRRGVSSRVLVAEASGTCRGTAYRLAPDIQRVTAFGTPIGGVPASGGTPEHRIDEVEPQTPLSRCPVTGFAVTPVERALVPLQENLSSSRHTSVTDGGTPSLKRPAGADLHDDVLAGRCCGRDGAELRCKLCRWSSAYLPALRRARHAAGGRAGVDPDFPGVAT